LNKEDLRGIAESNNTTRFSAIIEHCHTLRQQVNLIMARLEVELSLAAADCDNHGSLTILFLEPGEDYLTNLFSSSEVLIDAFALGTEQTREELLSGRAKLLYTRIKREYDDLSVGVEPNKRCLGDRRAVLRISW
jgi:hypothetical protein